MKKKEIKNKVLQIRLTKHEYEMLSDLVKSQTDAGSHMPLSAYVRWFLLEHMVENLMASRDKIAFPDTDEKKEKYGII